jgi:hypothetical protein
MRITNELTQPLLSRWSQKLKTQDAAMADVSFVQGRTHYELYYTFFAYFQAAGRSEEVVTRTRASRKIRYWFHF